MRSAIDIYSASERPCGVYNLWMPNSTRKRVISQCLLLHFHSTPKHLQLVYEFPHLQMELIDLRTDNALSLSENILRRKTDWILCVASPTKENKLLQSQKFAQKCVGYLYEKCVTFVSTYICEQNRFNVKESRYRSQLTNVTFTRTRDTCSPDTSCIHLYPRVEHCFRTCSRLHDMYPSTCRQVAHPGYFTCKRGLTDSNLQSRLTSQNSQSVK